MTFTNDIISFFFAVNDVALLINRGGLARGGWEVAVGVLELI